MFMTYVSLWLIGVGVTCLGKLEWKFDIWLASNSYLNAAPLYKSFQEFRGY